jgi:glutathione S-transferase
MIKLYRRADCPRCSDIEDALEQLGVAFRVFKVAPGEPLPAGLPEGGRMPVLVDGEEVFQGSSSILDHLEETAAFKALWYKYQSDACYCEE